MKDLGKHPYFINPLLKRLPSATGEERAEIIRHIAAAVGDPVTLRSLLGITPEEFRAFYPDMEEKNLSTSETIDSFIDRFSSQTAPVATEVEDLLPPPGAALYDISMLEEEENGDFSDAAIGQDDTSDMLDTFLSANPPKKPTRRHEPPKPSNTVKPAAIQKPLQSEEEAPASVAGTKARTEAADASLSESLAAAMIKNGNYQKALEIITELSLNNPKKSIYFADQIRFLKKLASISRKS